MHDLSTTLVAVASPPGRGGVGCLRISGPQAAEIARRLFQGRATDGSPTPGGPPRFGRFMSRDGRALDHGYLMVFRAGGSFTGELTAELWTHGSPVVLAELVEGAIAAGAEHAGPGEFTYRALRNGRIDLTQAEAVRDLVEARTVFQARTAFAQAEGALARRLAPLRESLEEWIARAEAAVEFEESETELSGRRWQQAIEHVRGVCNELLAGFRLGRMVREGASVVIAGLPNVGKSSLFNRLLGRERAIVTEVAGTTRDTLEEPLDLEGILVRLIDTAGLREVADAVEREGVRRARQAHGEAEMVLLVLDGSRPLEPSELRLLDEARQTAPRETLAVLNKSDLPARGKRAADLAESLEVSALTGAGIEKLRAELRRRLVGSGALEDPIVTNGRHARALEQTAEALTRATDAAREGFSEEFVLEDLRAARQHLGRITGEFGQNELYDKIFSTFCIGK